MKRQFNYAGSATKLFIKDRFGNLKGETLSLKQGLNELEILPLGEYYQSEANERFFIYEGQGALESAHALKRYDFYYLNISFLDEFLKNGVFDKNADEFDQRLIKEFVEVYELNINKGSDYLLPPFFTQAQKKLLGG